MRVYEKATIVDATQTGFQSACSEFAAKPLSLDEKFNIGNPSIHLLEVEVDDPKLGLGKGDALLIDQSRRPVYGDLVVVEDRLLRFTTKSQIEDEMIFGVALAVFKNINQITLKTDSL
jgi:hypothetical protein